MGRVERRASSNAAPVVIFVLLWAAALPASGLLYLLDLVLAPFLPNDQNQDAFSQVLVFARLCPVAAFPPAASSVGLGDAPHLA